MIENHDEGVSDREDHDMIAAMDSNSLTMMTMMTWSMPLEYWGVVGLACPCQPDKGGLQSSLSVLGLTPKEDEWIGEVLKNHNYHYCVFCNYRHEDCEVGYKEEEPRSFIFVHIMSFK